MFTLMGANGFHQLQGKYIKGSNGFDRKVTGLIPGPAGCIWVGEVKEHRLPPPSSGALEQGCNPPTPTPLPNCSSGAAHWPPDQTVGVLGSFQV